MTSVMVFPINLEDKPDTVSQGRWSKSDNFHRSDETLANVAFTLVTSSGDSLQFGDRASYSFNQAGFLVVVTDEGTRLTYAHGAWHHVEDTPRSSAW